MPERDVLSDQLSPVAIVQHARRAPAGRWFVFVGDVGHWDSSFVFMGWN